MKSLAIINDRIQESLPVESTGTANISGTNITCGIVDVPRPHFDAKQEYNKDHVLVEVTAFSCNYRDKGLILKSAKKMGGDFGKILFRFLSSVLILSVKSECAEKALKIFKRETESFQTVPTLSNPQKISRQALSLTKLQKNG